jgi:hypothetical protein
MRRVALLCSNRADVRWSAKYAGFLRDDPIGVTSLWDTVSQLADEPQPPESFPYRSPDLRRLRAGRYRIFRAAVGGDVL